MGFICHVKEIRIFLLENEEQFEVYLAEDLNCGRWTEERVKYLEGRT